MVNHNIVPRLQTPVCNFHDNIHYQSAICIFDIAVTNVILLKSEVSHIYLCGRHAILLTLRGFFCFCLLFFGVCVCVCVCVWGGGGGGGGEGLGLCATLRLPPSNGEGYRNWYQYWGHCCLINDLRCSPQSECEARGLWWASQVVNETLMTEIEVSISILSWWN